MPASKSCEHNDHPETSQMAAQPLWPRFWEPLRISIWREKMCDALLSGTWNRMTWNANTPFQGVSCVGRYCNHHAPFVISHHNLCVPDSLGGSTLRLREHLYPMFLKFLSCFTWKLAPKKQDSLPACSRRIDHLLPMWVTRAGYK